MVIDRALLLVAVLSAAPVVPVGAQGRGELALPRLIGSIRIDGMMTDSAWTAIAPLPLTMYSPTFGGAPVERTEIRIGYDDQYLYAGGWFFDSDPSGIRVNTLYRDRYAGDDAFALFVDPFNDNENGIWFATNPAGVRVDRSITADARSFSDSWNGVWDVATRITDQGWFAEMRIPLATLGFQARDGRLVMGLTVTRVVARTNERVTFPAIDSRYEFRQPSIMQDVVLTGVTPKRPVYLAPFVLSGVDRTVAAAPNAGYRGTDRVVGEAGLDLRYDVADNLHLDLSVNTDFAQVEADDEQLNLTRFPLFFPEKRQFFQERAGLFDFDFGSGGRLFHSRQIGLAPDRTPIRMLGGARVVARSGRWDIAALDAQTARRGAIPSENLGAARLKGQVLNPFSYLGAMMTSRVDEDGGHNQAFGADASIRVFGEEQLTIRAASTFDDDVATASLAERSQLYLKWERRASRGLNYFSQLNRVGAAYRPDLGFLPRQDFTRLAFYSTYGFFPKQSIFQSHGPGVIGNFVYRNADHALESRYLAYWWNYAFRSGAQGWLEVIHNFEDVTTPFELGDGARVEAGGHHFTELWFNFQAASGPLLKTGVDLRIGEFYDGSRTRLQLLPTWNVSRHLEIGGSYEYNRIRFPDRTGLDAHLATLRIGAAANARVSATALLQLNSVTDRLGGNLRLRYNFREGSDLWLVYDQGFNTDRDPDPGFARLPFSDVRVIRVKLTHTLVP